MNVSEALSYARELLAGASETPARDASLLLSHVLGTPPEYPYLHPEATISGQDFTAFAALVQRRKIGEPIAYLRGIHEFMGFTFKVDRRVLIPRPETEHVVEALLEIFDGVSSPLVADVCCGSGAIGLSFAKITPSATVILTDVSREAVALARENAESLGVSGRVTVLCGDLIEPLKEHGLSGKVDALAANPPYISHDEMGSLPVSVRDYEPHLALDGGKEGLEIIERIACQAPAVLKPRGHLVMEIGADQGEAVSGILANTGLWQDTTVLRDYAGRQRVVISRTRAV